MKQMICYLYEFHHQKKIKNVGFIRCIPYSDKVIFQFHGKGLGFTGVGEFQGYLFYMEDGICYVESIGQLDGVHGNVNSMIEVTGTAVTMGDGLDRFQGILLRQSGGQTYVATWQNVAVDVEHIRQVAEESDVPSVMQEEEPSLAGQPEPEAREELSSTVQMEPRVEPELEEEPSLAGKPEPEPEEEPGPIVQPEPEAREEPRPAVEPEPRAETARDFAPESAFEFQQQESNISYEKIIRQDLARLPRKEWKLANNSFLLHGFYNYKHLLFIKEKGQLYLGVPGVFHKKESEAARTFGFEQFHRLEKDLKLKTEEQSPGEDFGYWCRPVSQLEPSE